MTIEQFIQNNPHFEDVVTDEMIDFLQLTQEEIDQIFDNQQKRMEAVSGRNNESLS